MENLLANSVNEKMDGSLGKSFLQNSEQFGPKKKKSPQTIHQMLKYTQTSPQSYQTHSMEKNLVLEYYSRVPRKQHF